MRQKRSTIIMLKLMILDDNLADGNRSEHTIIEEAWLAFNIIDKYLAQYRKMEA